MNIRTLPIDQLVLDPKNARTHDKRNLETIHNSIAQFGQVENIVVQAGTHKVIGGNGRVQAMRDAGATTVEANVVDVTDAQAAKMALALNRTAQLAGWSKANLADTVADLVGHGIDVADIGFNDAELADLIGLPDLSLEADDDAVAEPSEGAAVSKVGDIWQLGEHRLMCGDSTCANHVNALMQGRDAFIMVTDPPYGVDYNPRWREGHGVGKKWRTDTVQNDTESDWSESYSLFAGDVAYVWSPPGPLMCNFIYSVQKSGLEFKHCVIWNKHHAPMSRGCYHQKFEPCLFACRKGRPLSWVGGRAQTTVWDINVSNGWLKGSGDNADTVHPTQKPLECMARPMRNHGKKGDLAYDPFLGSGTSIIAAERTERICYGLELNPKYADVSVERWQNATGGKAVKVTSG